MPRVAKLTHLSKPGEWIEFVVPGPPKGYLRRTRYGKHTAAARAYHDYMIEVQACARAAGLYLPLEAAEGSEIMIRTWAQFVNRRHPDPSNVHKGIEDALFYVPEDLRKFHSTNGDKYVGGNYGYPRYGDRAFVSVMVERVIHE